MIGLQWWFKYQQYLHVQSLPGVSTSIGASLRGAGQRVWREASSIFLDFAFSPKFMILKKKSKIKF
jgi:hypothetical protein